VRPWLLALILAAVLPCVFGSPGARGQDLKSHEEELIKLTESSMKYCVKVEVLRRRWPQVGAGRDESSPRDDRLDEELTLSGILLDSDGHVATLSQALFNARRVSASVFDGTTETFYKARVVGTNPEGCIGVIRLEAEAPFSTPILAGPEKIKPGAFVIGLGFPFDLGPCPSVAIGVVSATQRRFTAGTVTYDDLIETSFLLRPGESGGPLLNSRGEIVGLMLTSYNGRKPLRPTLTTLTRNAAGISLAVPVSTVTREVEKILDQRALAGAVSEDEQAPWIGIEAEDIQDPALRNQLKLQEGGVMICQIYAGQPAAKAGIQKHDILVEWKDERVKGLDHLHKLFTGAGIGDEVKLILLRNGKEIHKVIIIGKN